MKKMTWYKVVFTFLGIGLGLGIGLLASYWKAYVFGGIEEETVVVYILFALLIFVPLSMITGKIIEKRIG